MKKMPLRSTLNPKCINLEVRILRTLLWRKYHEVLPLIQSELSLKYVFYVPCYEENTCTIQWHLIKVIYFEVCNLLWSTYGTLIWRKYYNVRYAFNVLLVWRKHFFVRYVFYVYFDLKRIEQKEAWLSYCLVRFCIHVFINYS